MEENPNPVVATRRQQLLNSVVEGNNLAVELRAREADPGFLFEYLVYSVLEERVIGTVVLHRDRAAAQQSRALTAPAFSIERGQIIGLVYGCLYLDIDEYISELKLEWGQKNTEEKARDKKAATDHALLLFRNIAEILRNQIVSQAPPFPKLDDFFGITEAGSVKLLRASINDSRATYSENLKDLGKIATKLRDYLQSTVGDKDGASELDSFVVFLGFRKDCKSLPAYTIDYISIHHPATLDLINNARLIFNLAELCTLPRDEHSLLMYCSSIISTMLKGWHSSAKKVPRLYNVLYYELPGYFGDEVARFAANALKHCKRTSKEEVMRTLDNRLGMFRHVLLYSYLAALSGGYTNPKHDYTHVCGGYI